jgi:hypothetical protein
MDGRVKVIVRVWSIGTVTDGSELNPSEVNMHLIEVRQTTPPGGWSPPS